MRIGIDIGGSHISSGIIEKNGELLAKETMDVNISNITDEERIKKLIFNIIKNKIDTLLDKNDYSASDILKIGVAVPR